jgi:hypothetical protein
MLTFAEDIAAAWNTHCSPWQNENTTLTTVDGVDLSSTSGASATAVVSHAGNLTTAPVDNAIAAIIKYEIDRRYRGGKPKMYFPGADTSMVADVAHWTTAAVNGLATAFNAFNGALTALTVSGTALDGLWNISFYQGFTSAQNPVTHRWRNIPSYRAVPLQDAVNSFTVDALMGSQKRRRTA